jgi:hypothetical protein
MALEWLLGMAAEGPALHASDAPERLEVGNATIYVSLESDKFDLPKAALLEWVTQSALAVSAYYGRFSREACWVADRSFATRAHFEREELR